MKIIAQKINKINFSLAFIILSALLCPLSPAGAIPPPEIINGLTATLVQIWSIFVFILSFGAVSLKKTILRSCSTKKIIGALMVLVTLSGAFLFLINKSYDEITPLPQYEPDSSLELDLDEAIALVDAGEAVLFDSRTEKEYLSGHLNKSILWNDNDDPAEIARNYADKTIILYCMTGFRSDEISMKLLRYHPKIRITSIKGRQNIGEDLGSVWVGDYYYTQYVYAVGLGEAKSMIESGYVLVDPRSASDFEQMRFPGSTNLPVKEDNVNHLRQTAKGIIDKNLLIVCQDNASCYDGYILAYYLTLFFKLDHKLPIFTGLAELIETNEDFGLN
jgi:rhodanese-related sulfurtransferase